MGVLSNKAVLRTPNASYKSAMIGKNMLRGDGRIVDLKERASGQDTPLPSLPLEIDPRRQSFSSFSQALLVAFCDGLQGLDSAIVCKHDVLRHWVGIFWVGRCKTGVMASQANATYSLRVLVLKQNSVHLPRSDIDILYQFHRCTTNDFLLLLCKFQKVLYFYSALLRPLKCCRLT